MRLTFHITVTHFLGTLKKKNVHTKDLYFTFTIFFPRLSNLGAQIRYVQNRYNAVQTDLQYPPGSKYNQLDLNCFKSKWKQQRNVKNLFKFHMKSWCLYYQL